MVLGSLYVNITQPLPDVATQVFLDSSNINTTTSFNGAMKAIQRRPTSMYDKAFARGKVAANINMVFYIVVALLIGYYNYSMTPNEEKDLLSQLGVPLLFALVLCAITYGTNYVEVFAMYSYRSVLSELVGRCGGVGDSKAFRNCFNEYKANQARLEAARIQAQASDDIANALRRSRDF